jgi:two-component system, cell cycle response regulator
MIDSPEILNVIENASLFRGISHELLAPLLKKSKLIALKQGDKLLSPGIINEHVYIIISGHLSVQVTPSNLDGPIAMLAPGECVGEMSVLVDSMVSAYVIATTNCQLLAIDYSAFWSLLNGSNEAARNMLNILVQRIRLGNEIVADSLLHHNHFPDNDIVDALTGLYNHHGMHGKFDRLLHRCVIGNQPLCLIELEVDELEKNRYSERELRDDQSLRTIAQTMLTFLRPDDYAARLIGKKFVVLLANLSLADACTTAERLRTAISHVPIILPNGSTLPPFTISVGVSEALPNDTWNTLLARADIALERAINAGRNRVAHT